jgi:hypothetical protein
MDTNQISRSSLLEDFADCLSLNPSCANYSLGYVDFLICIHVNHYLL